MANENVAEINVRQLEHGFARDAAEEFVRLVTDCWVDKHSVIDDISFVVVFINVRSGDVDVAQAPQRMAVCLGSGSDHDFTEEESREATGEQLFHAQSTRYPGYEDGFARHYTVLPTVTSVQPDTIGRPNGIDNDFFANIDEGSERDSRGNNIDFRVDMLFYQRSGTLSKLRSIVSNTV